MAIGPGMFAPPVPGVTKTDGLAAGTPPPTDLMSMLALLMGNRPAAPDTTMEKMSQVIQLLRELSKEDPKVAGLVSGALNMLVNGPPTMARPPSPMMGGGPGGGMGVPLMGSPGTMA